MTEEAPLQKIATPDPRKHYELRFLILTVLLIVVAFASVCVGRYSVSPQDFLDIIHGLITGDYGDVDASSVTAVLQVRLPRVIVGLAVGAALSVAGAAYQGVFQNPMVSQDVLGASSGAAFGASLAIWLALGGALTTTFAFVLGIAAVVVSYLVSQISRSNPILSLILAGMVVSALFSSGTSTIKLVADTESALPAITYWLMGSLASIRAANVAPTLIMVALGVAPLVFMRWRINILATGEDEARSLGMNTNLMRIIFIGCSTFLTAVCVSVSGLIGWVGLVIPHFCRMMFGNDYRRVVPACLLMGASFLVAADDLCRILATSEIPIGILTSYVGAPIFIYLIAKGGGGFRGKFRS